MGRYDLASFSKLNPFNHFHWLFNCFGAEYKAQVASQVSSRSMLMLFSWFGFWIVNAIEINQFGGLKDNR